MATLDEEKQNKSEIAISQIAVTAKSSTNKAPSRLRQVQTKQESQPSAPRPCRLSAKPVSVSSNVTSAIVLEHY